MDKLCLPCKLVLPKSGSGVSSSEGGVRGRATGASSSGGGGGSDFGRGRGGDVGDGSGSHQVRRRPVTMQEALKTGAGVHNMSLFSFNFMIIVVQPLCICNSQCILVSCIVSG